MIASEVGVCNSALAKIGESEFITTLTENNKRARVCNQQYFILRDALLRRHQWNFATKRVKLALDVNTPVSEFDFQYILPADWLRTVRVYDNDAALGTLRYRILGNVIESNSDEVWLTYIFRVTNVNAMTADFQEALAYRLAVELATPVAQSKSLREQLREDFKAQLRTAKSSDSIEDFPQAFPEGSWVTDRF